MPAAAIPVFLLVACVLAFCVGLLVLANLLGPSRPSRVKAMPYESGMDPLHGARRRFDVRFYLVAVAFLVFDVELLFLYPWAVAQGAAAGCVEGRHLVFGGAMVFLALLAAGYVYDWRKGVFRWR